MSSGAKGTLARVTWSDPYGVHSVVFSAPVGGTRCSDARQLLGKCVAESGVVERLAPTLSGASRAIISEMDVLLRGPRPGDEDVPFLPKLKVRKRWSSAELLVERWTASGTLHVRFQLTSEEEDVYCDDSDFVDLE